MAEHPPEYEYRVRYDGLDAWGQWLDRPCTETFHFSEEQGIQYANRLRARHDRRNVVIERRFIGPWHAMCDGDEAPAADRQQAVFDTTTWAEDGIMQTDLKYRGIVGVHEIPEPRGTEVRLLVDLDAPVIDAF